MSTISREELIRVIDYRITHTKDARKSRTSQFVDGMEDGYARIRSDVLLMPSAQPERKKGKWICLQRHHHKCSVCGNFLDFRGVNAGRGDANFCPNCGADMRGEKGR